MVVGCALVAFPWFFLCGFVLYFGVCALVLGFGGRSWAFGVSLVVSERPKVVSRYLILYPTLYFYVCYCCDDAIRYERTDNHNQAPHY